MTKEDWPELKPTFRRRAMGWVGYCAFGVALAVLVLSSVGVVYQRIGVDRDRRAYPPPGRLVDVGGHRLHVRIDGAGVPPVVFESGLGGSSIDWGLVAPEIAKITQVVTYDRAGMGWSEAGPKPRTAARIASELRALLEAAGVKGPYLLVAHSLGGFSARMFYYKYPEDVSAMVLVDSSHEDQNERFGARAAKAARRMRALTYGTQALSSLGAIRAAGHYWGRNLILGPYNGLPQADRAMVLSHASRPLMYETVRSEFGAMDESSRALRAAERPMRELPLAVLTGTKGYPDFAFDTWQELQRELASRSDRSDHVVVEGSGHYIQLDRPDVVIEAIRKLVRAYRAEAGIAVDRVGVRGPGKKVF